MRSAGERNRLPSVLYWMIAATLVLPLVIWSNSFAPFHFGKVLVFRWLVEAMMVVWVALMLKDPSYRPRWSSITIAVMGVMASVALSSIVGVDFLRSWWGTWERMGGLFTFLHYGAWFVVVSSVVRTKAQWRQLIILTVGVATLSALYSFLQKAQVWKGWLQGDELSSPVGTIGNAALFSGYLILNAFLGFSLFSHRRRAVRFAAAAAVAVMAMALWFAFVRGAIAGSFVGLLVFAVLVPAASARARAVRRLVIAALAVLIAAGFFVALAPRNALVQAVVPASVRSFDFGDRTVQSRLWAWGSAWRAFQDRPLLGWGLDNFHAGFNQYFNPKHFTSTTAEAWFDRAHTMVLDAMVAQGLVGLLAWGALWALVLRKLWRLRSREPLLASSLIAGLVAYGIHDSWILDTFSHYLMLFFVAALADRMGNEEEVRVDAMPVARAPRRRVPVVVALIVAVVLAWWGGLRPWMVNRSTVSALRAGAASIPRALAHWENALDGTYAGKPESLFHLALYAIRLNENGRLPFGKLEQTQGFALGAEVSQQERRDVLLFANRKLSGFLESHPLEAQLVIFLGRIQNMLAQRGDVWYAQQAEVVMRRGVAISPTRPPMHHELAQALLYQGRFADALAFYERARDDNPDVAVSWWYVGLAQSLVGNHGAAFEAIAEARLRGFAPERDSFSARRMAQVHRAAGNEQEAQAWEKLAAARDAGM